MCFPPLRCLEEGTAVWGWREARCWQRLLLRVVSISKVSKGRLGEPLPGVTAEQLPLPWDREGTKLLGVPSGAPFLQRRRHRPRALRRGWEQPCGAGSLRFACCGSAWVSRGWVGRGSAGSWAEPARPRSRSCAAWGLLAAGAAPAMTRARWEQGCRTCWAGWFSQALSAVGLESSSSAPSS